MSECRQQAWIDAPKEVVWELIADVNRHPEWWPRIVEVDCEELSETCTYRELVQTPFGGTEEFNISVDRLDDPREMKVRCLNTGTFFHLVLTEAQGGTFVEGRFGMEPNGIANRAFDAIAGRRYFRRWLADSLESMDRVATERARSGTAG